MSFKILREGLNLLVRLKNHRDGLQVIGLKLKSLWYWVLALNIYYLSLFSGGKINITPKLKQYIRDWKAYIKLHTPDISFSCRSRLNLECGPQTIIECQKQINAFLQQISRLQKQVKTFKDHQHLKEQNQISATEADVFIVSFKEIGYVSNLIIFSSSTVERK